MLDKVHLYVDHFTKDVNLFNLYVLLFTKDTDLFKDDEGVFEVFCFEGKFFSFYKDVMILPLSNELGIGLNGQI